MLRGRPSSAAPPVRHLLQTDPEFPARLLALPSPARALWVRGALPGPEHRSLAIVGARAASLAGCRLAHRSAEAAANHGWGVISGGALGIDAAAHRGALAARQPTFAVLGCGVDVVYPDRHGALFEEIARSGAGGLMTEYPPGTPPRGQQFPSRNRLVAGLADAVLVVEASVGSGALITARLAVALGRRLFAIPGSPGTDALLARGAAARVEEEDDLVRVLEGGAPAPPRMPPALFAPVLEVLRGLPSKSAGPVELALALRMGLPETLALLAEAELEGWIRRRPSGAFASLEAVSNEVARGSE